MDTLIKFPLSIDVVNECIIESDGKVFLRYTWGTTPLAWLRQQEAKAKEIVDKLNSLHDNFPQAVAAAVTVASRENGSELSSQAEPAPKRKGNPAWYKGMVHPRWGKKGS